MAIYAQNKIATPYMGCYKPVNLYRGREKVAGWTWAERQGTAVEFEDTYNDAAYGVISGHSAQSGTPSPSAPIPILSAGGYDLMSANADGIKSSSIAMPTLRSLPNGAKDTLTYKGGGMWEHVQRVGVKVFDGTEGSTRSTVGVNYVFSSVIASGKAGYYQDLYCTHYKLCKTWPTTIAYANNIMTNSAATFQVGFIGPSDIDTIDEMRAFLAAQHAAGTPVTVLYELATPIITMLNLGNLRTYPRKTQIHQDTTGLLADLTLTARVVDKEAE